MRKQEQFKELRDELTLEYQKELSDVQKLLDGGVTCIENGQAAIYFGEKNSLILDGEAGRVFREEVADALAITLARYARNLAKEVESLGLKFPQDKPGVARMNGDQHVNGEQHRGLTREPVQD